jgi:hypothetical protein
MPPSALSPMTLPVMLLPSGPTLIRMPCCRLPNPAVALALTPI